MSQVRILLRWFLLMTTALVISACRSASDAYAPSPGGGALVANPCRSGEGKADLNAPIVCVDDTADTLSLDPDPITAHSVGQADRQPVMIHWWTKSGGNALSLEIQSGCVTEVKCNGAHCSARTLRVTERTRCKYDVWTDKHPKLDPEIVIDPCC